MRKADRVTDDLMTRICSGEIPVGSVLPKETELATHYGVNRSVIREAIKLLEVHRLVRPVRRRGTEVLDPVASLSAEVLRTLVVPDAGRIDRAMFANLLEIRTLIDVEMARLATLRRTEADLIVLADMLEQLRGALGQPKPYSDRVHQFSLLVARATKNPIFEMMVHWQGRIATDLGDFFLATRMPTGPHLRGLEYLVELVRKRDAETVEAVVRAFHAWASPRLLEAAGEHIQVDVLG